MVKTEHQLQSMPWDTHHSQQQQQQQQSQQLDYYMNVPGNSYTSVSLIINNTNTTNRINCNGTPSTTVDPKMSPLPTGTTPQTVPTSTPKSRLTSVKNSSSPSNEYNSTMNPQHKEIYPWMSDKKHGTNKNKTTSKTNSGHNTTSTSSSSSSSGKICCFHRKEIITCEDEKSIWVWLAWSRVNRFAREIKWEKFMDLAVDSRGVSFFDTLSIHNENMLLIYSDQLTFIFSSLYHQWNLNGDFKKERNHSLFACLFIEKKSNRLFVSTYTCFSSSFTDRRARARVHIFSYWRW